MRYNVLYMNIASAIGGAERSLLCLLENLDKDRFRSIVAVKEECPLVGFLKERGIETIKVPIGVVSTNSLNPIPYLKTVNILRALIKKHDINLIHSNTEATSQCAVLAAKISGTPIVCHVRNILLKKAFIRDLIGWNNVLIATSKAVANNLQFSSRANKRIRIIPNAVDLKSFTTDEFIRTSIRQSMGYNREDVVIGIMGSRIAPLKGQHIAIKALEYIIDSGHDNVRLLITGSPEIDGADEYLYKLKDTIKRTKLGKYVKFTGFVGDIVPIYNAIDHLVLPSMKEPFGRVLIEAMAMGKTVIATRDGGPMDIVEDGKTGILVTPNNPEELASAILQIINSKVLSRNLICNAMRRVNELYNPKKHIESIQDVYEELLARRYN